MNIHPSIRGTLSVIARGEVGSPEISGDGTTVVFNAYDGKTTAVYLYQEGDTVRLSDDHASMHPDVSADGSTVTYTRYSAASLNQPGSWDIVRYHNGQRELIADGPGNEMGPKISSDGSTIVWDDDLDGTLGKGDIKKWVDGEVSTVVEGPPWDLFPEVSGDGSRVVWRRLEGGKMKLWMQDQNGVVKPFLEKEGDIIRPSLNHDGTQLVFTDNSRGNDDLVFHDETTRTERVVAGLDKVDETWACLSEDGSTIAWTGLDFRKGAPADTEIYLETNGRIVKVTEDDGLSSFPRLSEDGKTLVWFWMDKEDLSDRRIYKLDIEGLPGA